MTRRGDASPVYVFNGQRWAETPTFHLAPGWNDRGHTVDEFELDDGNRRVEHRTLAACGRVASAWGWTTLGDEVEWSSRYVDQQNVEHAFVMRRDHAEKIGRLCDRCRARGDDS